MLKSLSSLVFFYKSFHVWILNLIHCLWNHKNKLFRYCYDLFYVPQRLFYVNLSNLNVKLLTSYNVLSWETITLLTEQLFKLIVALRLFAMRRQSAFASRWIKFQMNVSSKKKASWIWRATSFTLTIGFPGFKSRRIIIIILYVLIQKRKRN